MKHTPLEDAKLSGAARKALAPGPLRMMAARGLAPLPQPGDLITVLYQLALDADGKIAEAAKQSAAGLPEKVLGTALADRTLDARVLDYFAGQVAGKAALIEIVLLNPATGDETVARLAGRLGAKEVGLIAQNEQRLLRCPEIIGAMYMNRHAPMSTVDRAVELAVRNQIKVPGIPAWDEVVRAVMGAAATEAPATSAEIDALFAGVSDDLFGDMAPLDEAGADAISQQADELVAAQEQEGEAPEIPISQMPIPMKIRLATLGNAFARAVLIRDTNKMVSMAAIKAPGVTELEAAKYASNSALSEDVMTYIGNKREWTKMYGVKLALVQNPKTPLGMSMRFLQHLRDKDVKIISRSKGIPAALATQAKKLTQTRSRGAPKK